MPERFRASTELYLNAPARYKNFELSEQAFSDFAAILQLSREHNVEVQLFIPPEHVVLQEALRVRGLWDTYWGWKERIATLAPYWDFSGYNTITAEPIEPGMSLYWDASHFRKPVGDLVLDRIHGIENPALPPEFGRSISASNVAEWRTLTEQLREEWAATHVDVINWVKARADLR